LQSRHFDYIEKDSGIFGKVKRPLITVEIRTKAGDWLEIKEVLADTGADISIFPRNIAELAIENIEDGKTLEVKGIVPYSKLIVFIHELAFRINGKIFGLPVAVADSDDVPPILGRVKGLDIFSCTFESNKVLMKW